MGAWWGVDLDGTLAEYGGWKGKENIGRPLMPMVEKIKEWLVKEREVKIFTARVSSIMHSPKEIEEETTRIQNWLESECGLPRLKVTAEKDYMTIEIWDDRCVQVEFNTGKRKHEEIK